METRLLFAVRRGRTFIRVNAVEKLNQLENANLQPGFFPQFAADRFLQGFPNFDAAARDGPFAKQGLGTTTNEHGPALVDDRSEEHTSELQSRLHLVCRLLLEKKKKIIICYRFYEHDGIHMRDDIVCVWTSAS